MLCTIYEILAIHRILQYDLGDVRKDKLAAFTHLYRLMDDVRILNGDAIHEVIFNPQRQGDHTATTWIYPSCLQIKETTGENGTVVFLESWI